MFCSFCSCLHTLCFKHVYIYIFRYLFIAIDIEGNCKCYCILFVLINPGCELSLNTE